MQETEKTKAKEENAQTTLEELIENKELDKCTVLFFNKPHSIKEAIELTEKTRPTIMSYLNDRIGEKYLDTKSEWGSPEKFITIKMDFLVDLIKNHPAISLTGEEATALLELFNKEVVSVFLRSNKKSWGDVLLCVASLCAVTSVLCEKRKTRSSMLLARSGILKRFTPEEQKWLTTVLPENELFVTKHPVHAQNISNKVLGSDINVRVPVGQYFRMLTYPLERIDKLIKK